MFTPADHQDLILAIDLMSWASELVNGVMERRRLDLTMQAISLLSEAKRDADLGERAAGMADRYMNWAERGEAS